MAQRRPIYQVYLSNLITIVISVKAATFSEVNKPVPTK